MHPPALLCRWVHGPGHSSFTLSSSLGSVQVRKRCTDVLKVSSVTPQGLQGAASHLRASTPKRRAWCWLGAALHALGSCHAPQLPSVSSEHFSSSHDAISDEELLHVSEQLYGADRNKAQPKDIAINPQHQVDPDQTGLQEDRSPEP